jgi:hypothetical protein
MELWRVDVARYLVGSGLSVIHTAGKLVMIDGEEFVRDSYDLVTRRNGRWFSCRAEAEAAAADEVQEVADQLLAQAQKLREDSHAPA